MQAARLPPQRLFRCEGADDFFEARIAAQRIPNGISFNFPKLRLARMERANPLGVQTLDVVGAFTALAAVSPFLHLLPQRLPESG